MAYFELEFPRGTFTRIAGDVTIGGTTIPYGSLDAWDARLLAAYGVIRREDPVEAPRIPSISDRQFFEQAAIDGKITEQEALDAVRTGVIPLVLQAFVDDLPADQKFGAVMLLSGATTFERDHPMSAAIGAVFQMDDAQIDDFFKRAAQR